MEFAAIDARVRIIISDVTQCPLSDVKAGASLECDLSADVLDLIEIVMELESEYDFDIHEEVIDAWKTVADITAFVACHVPPESETS